MKEIILMSAHMENFKRFKDITIEFEKNTSIYAENFRGKSSVADAFSWVLFNKSATGNSEGSQFRPRRYDENGVNIDHVDVVVEIKMLIDGAETKIRKVQRQNWVRHRGSDYEVYEGDETAYEWNDVPVSPTEHKKRVAEIISEEVFLLITNPGIFPSKPAKWQREFLMQNVEQISNSDVIEAYPELSTVIDAMGKLTLDELEAKNNKAIDGYEKKKKELPIRIDQESSHIEEVDVSGKEKELEKLNKELADIDAKIDNAGKVVYENLNALRTEKARLDSELLNIERTVRAEEDAKKSEIQDRIDNASYEFNACHERQKTLESTVKIDNLHIQKLEDDLSKLREEYKKEMSKELDEDAYICPTCGQEIPEDQKETVKAEFESKKAAVIKFINEKGNALNTDNKRTKEEMAGRLEEIDTLKAKKVEAMSIENKAKQELEELNNAPSDLINNKEYISTKEQIESLEKQINDVDTSNIDTEKNKLKEERAGIQASLDEVKKALALRDEIEKSKQIVKELEEAMKQNTQNLANCERLKKEIEKFRTTKNQMLSERVNRRFKVVKWKLFEKQKNGGTKEVCVCMIHGSQYGENTTSATERMMAGMDIINTLQEIYEVKAPIFLDDADLYNDKNIPDMDCQLIKLCVSQDDDLRIEVKA